MGRLVRAKRAASGMSPSVQAMEKVDRKRPDMIKDYNPLKTAADELPPDYMALLSLPQHCWLDHEGEVLHVGVDSMLCLFDREIQIERGGYKANCVHSNVRNDGSGDVIHVTCSALTAVQKSYLAGDSLSGDASIPAAGRLVRQCSLQNFQIPALWPSTTLPSRFQNHLGKLYT